MTDKGTGYDETIAAVIGRAEEAIYLVTALFLIIMAIASFFVVAGDLFQFTGGDEGMGVIYAALNDLLVVLIVVELIQTIVVFIRRHVIDLRLILAAGLTAMIRRVMLFGVEKNITSVDMAITALLIIVLAISIYLVGYRKVERSA
jgi:Phosphate-starvation-inducible E.